MLKAGVNPNETLIIEDSIIEAQAAINSGAFYIGLNSPQELSLELIERNILLNNVRSKMLQDKTKMEIR